VSAPIASVRRTAAKVSTCATMPPYVKVSGGSQTASTNVSSERPSATGVITSRRKLGAATPRRSRMPWLLVSPCGGIAVPPSTAVFHISSCDTNRSVTLRNVGSRSIDSTDSSIG
jgi:hypothetical protein